MRNTDRTYLQSLPRLQKLSKALRICLYAYSFRGKLKDSFSLLSHMFAISGYLCVGEDKIGLKLKFFGQQV